MLFVRLTAGVIATGLAFAGCSGGSLVPGSSAGQSSFSARVSQLSSDQQTFSFTGKPQTFVVPHGVKSIKVTANGASTESARGAEIAATIPVTPGESLTVMVGGSPKRLRGGWNGGADGGQGQDCNRCLGFGGAGASDVREHGSALGDRVVVAGGAGGQGGDGLARPRYHQESNHGKGGRGGFGGQPAEAGKMGVAKPSNGTGGGDGGDGATVRKGGQGGAFGEAGASGWSGTAGADGVRGLGGAGGINAGEFALNYQTAGCPSCTSGAGGGGGGGYFGGGGGGGGGSDTFGGGGGGGGGGGSSYVEKTATGVTSINGGAPNGNGEIIISW